MTKFQLYLRTETAKDVNQSTMNSGAVLSLQLQPKFPSFKKLGDLR